MVLMLSDCECAVEIHGHSERKRRGERAIAFACANMC